jgi:hypothetical protein
MMKMLILRCLSLMLLVQFSMNSVHAMVWLGADAKTDIKGVKLSDSAKTDASSPNLTRITQGLRQKKVVFAWFSVYAAQIFSSAPKPDFSSVESLKGSLTQNLPAIVSMTFVRDVEIEKIIEGFTEVFSANKMDATKVPYRDFLSALKRSGDIKDMQKFYFVFSSAENKSSFSVQTDGKEIFSLKNQMPEVVNSFFNMWLGSAPDSGLEQLQGQFLKHDAK